MSEINKTTAPPLVEHQRRGEPDRRKKYQAGKYTTKAENSMVLRISRLRVAPTNNPSNKYDQTPNIGAIMTHNRY